MLPSQAFAKWSGLVAGIWVQAFAGNAYTFAHYSSTLKTVLHYNQLQLNNLGVAKDVGENVGLLSGLVCNKLPPWAILFIGAFNGFIGYGVLWLVASQRIAPLPYWQMCAALCIGANSTTWFNTAVLVTCMRNFPHNRGTVVGFLKGFVGLSGAIFTQLFTGFLAKDPVKLLFLLAVGPTVVCIAAMSFVRPVKPAGGVEDESSEQTNFFFIYVVCLALAFFLLVATVVDDLVGIGYGITSKIIAGVMLLFLVAFVYVPVRVFVEGLFAGHVAESGVDSLTEPLISANKAVLGKDEEQECGGRVVANVVPQNGSYDRSQYAEKTRESCSPSPSGSFQQPVEIEEIDVDTLLAVGEGAVRSRRKGPRRGEDFKLRQALVKADFWLLFLTFFCGVGTGVTAINNLGQIGAAQGYTDVTIFVSLICVWNFLGRLGGGSVSERYVRSAAIPRPVWMAAAQALMIVAHLLFASAMPGSLHAASAILGICYGVQFSVMVPTASELFGLKHFGIIYNFINMADPLGSLLFSGLLAGYLYDWETEKEGIGIGAYSGSTGRRFNGWPVLLRAVDADCTGAHCFRLTFLIMAGVCVVGVMLCLFLSFRIKPVYKALYAARDPNNLSSASLPNLSFSSLPNLSSASLPPAVGVEKEESLH